MYKASGEVLLDTIGVPRIDCQGFLHFPGCVLHVQHGIGTTLVLNLQVRKLVAHFTFHKRLYLRVATDFSATHFKHGTAEFELFFISFLFLATATAILFQKAD